MEIDSYSGDDERAIITDLITRADVLASVAAHWEDKGLFSSWATNVLARLCVQYHTLTAKAPGRDITRLFSRWAKGKSDDSVKAVERVLAALVLPDEISGSGAFSLDVAGDYFNRVRIERLLAEAKLHLEEGRVKEAEELIEQHRRVELGANAAVDLFLDEAAVKSTFDGNDLKSLVPYDQGLYYFFHIPMQRGNFVAFQAPNKVGKSTWLCDVAWRAWTSKKRVAYFAVGDETEAQIKMRFCVRAAEHPHLSTNDDESWPCVVKIPKSIEPPTVSKGLPELRWMPKTFDAPLDKNTAWERVQEITQVKVGSTKSYFKMRVHAGLDLTVPKIRSTLEALARNGWVADVVVVDYADNLAPVNPKEAKYDQVNMTWKLLRALAIQRHCLVVTATQVKAAGFKVHTLDKTHFGEDNRKFAVATGVVSINQSVEEKRHGVYRLTWSALRGRQFDEEKACYVASCLPLGHPSVVSTF